MIDKHFITNNRVLINDKQNSLIVGESGLGLFKDVYLLAVPLHFDSERVLKRVVCAGEQAQ